MAEPVTALLNPDVELVDDSLLELADEARARPPERLLAPLVLVPRRHAARTQSIPRPTSAADLVRALVPPAALPVAPGRAGALARAPAAARGLGGRLRAGGADADAAAARARSTRRSSCTARTSTSGCAPPQAGVPTWFWPPARVLHYGAHATARGVRRRAVRAAGAGAPRVVARRLGARRARLDDLAQALTFASRIALKRALGRAAERERRQLQAVRGIRGAGGR